MRSLKFKPVYVAITGKDSDELFAGCMDRFGPFPSKLRDDVLKKDFLALAHQRPSGIGEFTDRVLQTKPGVERLNALQALDQWDRFPYYILRRADHLSMAHAVEVRVPFCQPRIFNYARQLPVEQRLSDGKYKRVVYESARGLIPGSVMIRRKQPFTLPVTAMIRPGTKLFDFVTATFESQRFRERGFFKPNKIRQYCEQQATNLEHSVAHML